MNHLAPKLESDDGLRVMDFSVAETVSEAADFLK